MNTNRHSAVTISFSSGTADILKLAREKAGYSVEDLAVATGLTHDEILDIENGSDEDPGRLRRVAAVLQVDLNAGQGR